VTFPITLPEGKFFTIHYKKTANSVTFTAGAGTTIVSPLTYTEQASFDAQGSVGQIGTTKIFRLGAVFNFLG
jgi:predicted membrane channel-forming protein YqfA (hemolysin III family)